ncbi:MBL fold metallo-hydrolase [Kocuria flava]|uniref:MBL fold metallo-hydrolase n=1 Tax=Kocuria flava TaxID=446860 RepID=UPI001FF614B5|nr:MBL fold metallo-hydrolase [Kocuria flava]MCJ8504981.1 MBL fold metallo-hydrolase [Kocuria flava]
MKLTIIGCTGSFAGPDSPASCYLVSGEDAGGRIWRVLLDMGNGALGVLQRHIDLHQIDAVLVSHLHPDHCIDLAGLHVAVKWDPRGWDAPRIPLWAPEGADRYLASTHGLPADPGMHGEFDFHAWRPERPVRIGPFTVTPYLVEHPTPEPYALRIDYDGVMGPSTLAYSGDTDACEGLVRAARDADVFLCEAAYHEGRDDALRGIHLTGRRAGEAARDAGVRKLLLTHLPVWNSPTRAVEEAEAVFAGPIGVAEPAYTYRVVRRTPPRPGRPGGAAAAGAAGQGAG